MTPYRTARLSLPVASALALAAIAVSNATGSSAASQRSPAGSYQLLSVDGAKVPVVRVARGTWSPDSAGRFALRFDDGRRGSASPLESSARFTISAPLPDLDGERRTATLLFTRE